MYWKVLAVVRRFLANLIYFMRTNLYQRYPFCCLQIIIKHGCIEIAPGDSRGVLRTAGNCDILRGSSFLISSKE